MSSLVVGAILIPITISGRTVNAPYPLTPLESLSISPTISNIKLAISYVASNMYDNGGQVSALITTMNNIAFCESNFNVKAYNSKGHAQGVFQFQSQTFYQFAKVYGIEKPNVWNPAQQIQVTALMLRDGLAHRWVCAMKPGVNVLK